MRCAALSAAPESCVEAASIWSSKPSLLRLASTSALGIAQFQSTSRSWRCARDCIVDHHLAQFFIAAHGFEPAIERANAPISSPRSP